jgi:hypothetical protein
MPENNRVDWRTIIRRIKSGKLTPIISDRIYFPGSNTLIRDWAGEIEYPYPVGRNTTIPQLAQFLSATSRDDLTAKEDFLDFSKQYLLKTVRENATPEQENFLDTLEDELYDISYSQAAERANFPKYEEESENPLRILAELPIPIYITTSYYNFLEKALKEAGKEPRTEICYWYDELDDVPSIFENDPDFQPSSEEPLVFHLQGLDEYASSLVLTEDDYLDLLVKVSEDIEAIPRRVAQALVDSSLCLLGFRLDDWNFKVIFRGLIKSKRDSRRRLSLSIQFQPSKTIKEEDVDPKDIENYLERYFDKANFDIYWGDALNFLQELWQNWES